MVVVVVVVFGFSSVVNDNDNNEMISISGIWLFVPNATGPQRWTHMKFTMEICMPWTQQQQTVKKHIEKLL